MSTKGRRIRFLGRSWFLCRDSRASDASGLSTKEILLMKDAVMAKPGEGRKWYGRTACSHQPQSDSLCRYSLLGVHRALAACLSATTGTPSRWSTMADNPLLVGGNAATLLQSTIWVIRFGGPDARHTDLSSGTSRQGTSRRVGHSGHIRRQCRALPGARAHFP